MVTFDEPVQSPQAPGTWMENLDEEVGATATCWERSVTTKAEAIALLAGQTDRSRSGGARLRDGMLAREAQRHLSGQRHRYSHGTTDTRHLVKSTGVMVAQFPHLSSGMKGDGLSPSARRQVRRASGHFCASSPAG